MTLIGSADTSAPRLYSLRGVALLSVASMVAAISLLAVPLTAQAATASPSQVSAVVPAAAVGKLAPSPSCAVIGSTRTCDLYAKLGTTSMPGGTPIDIWGFSSTATGAATAPGPVLVVNQGDIVTVALHNQLAGQDVSLAFPGQPTTAFSAGLSAQAAETGVATGATSTYTFTAGRAGTFIYEAGHTPNGTRQVAMGLAGALVVLPTVNSAAYADEAVVVLSEIDPALNAAPTTFDMRKFAPAYRLINGKPFPSTDVISTDQARTVLLRYVNVGSQEHSMSLLGADQKQVAQDGHAMTYAETEVIAAVDPGATVDTLVTMPSGPESKIALYEAAGRLDNNGQSTADPLSFAFGGMLTFLDTAYVDPAPSDGVGPVSSHVTVNPNPSDGLSAVIVTADLSDAATGGANVVGAEIVIDDAVTTGVGFGTPMTGTFGTVDVANATGTISTTVLDALPAGKHVVFVRAQDSGGNWGVVGSVILNLLKTGPQTTNGRVTPTPTNGALDVAISATGDGRISGGTIDAAEFFLDSVGPDSSGTPITPNRVSTVVSLNATIPAATVLALGEGTHHVFVHARTIGGLWGPTLDILLPVDTTGPGVEAASVGPNPTNGVLSDAAHPGYLVVSARIIDKDFGGALQNPVTDAEGFLDPALAVPAGGTGFQMVAVDGAMDSNTESVYGLIPISQVRYLTGVHYVSVRGQDSAGNWGPLKVVELTIDKIAPVLGALVATPIPAAGADVLTLTAPVSETALRAAEFWLGATTRGAGTATRVTFSVSGSNVVASVPLAAIPSGPQLFNLRVQDAAGNWSNAMSVTANVIHPNRIFSDGFDGGSLAAWSAGIGLVSATAAAGIGTPSGTTGLQVTLPGGAANQLSYVTDNTPTAEPTYHASFAFNANSLVTTSVLNLFEARTATAAVFTVQFRRNGTNNQIRTVMSRSGAGALNSTWFNLPAGTHTIQTDWAGATAGSLRLVLDGTVRSTLTGNTSTLRVETARLGLTAGLTTATTGTAYFDSFVSTRYMLP
ncbi:MAG: multicopper oxidase domain-containing protein [Dermatophilaceae bacterium]